MFTMRFRAVTRPTGAMMPVPLAFRLPRPSFERTPRPDSWLAAVLLAVGEFAGVAGLTRGRVGDTPPAHPAPPPPAPPGAGR
jgi:hypothetical protein